MLLLPALLDPARRAQGLAPALAVRFGEVLLSALRTAACFALVGKPIDPSAALVFACASNAANCVPMIGGGLGIREWITGLLAPGVAGVATPDALAAELLNRAVELLVVVPGGLASTPMLARRLAEAMRTRRVEPVDTVGGGFARAWSFSTQLPQGEVDESDPVPRSTPRSSDR